MRLRRRFQTGFSILALAWASCFPAVADESEALLVRALALGHPQAVESFCAAYQPDLNLDLHVSPQLRLRPISVVLRHLNSQKLRRMLPLVRYLGYRPADESQMLTLLFRLGAQPVYQEPDLEMQTPFHLLFQLPATQHAELASLLLRYRAHEALKLKNLAGQTPVDLAETQESKLAAKLKTVQPTGLSDLNIRLAPAAYASGNQALKRFESELHLIQAWRQKDLPAFRARLKALPPSPQVYLVSPGGQPLLQALALSGDLEYAQALIAAGVSPDQRDYAGRTALHQLAAQPRPDMLKAFIAWGAGLNLRDGAGDTPLFAAARAAQPDSFRLLLQAGADLNRVNTQGQSVRSWLESAFIQDAARYLEVHSALTQWDKEHKSPSPH